MSVLIFKPGVTLRPDGAGARLQGALDRVVRTWPADLTITAGSDSHGPTDPHTLGRAFDVRTHGLSDDQKEQLLRAVLLDLQEAPDDAPAELTIAGIWYAIATRRWFGQIEFHNQDNEHAHLQLRNGRTWPPPATGVATTT